MEKKTAVLAGLGVLVVLAAIFGGLFNVLNSPDCVFADGAKTCTVTYTLPENRSMSTFKMDLQFGKVPAAEFGASESLVRVATASTREETCRSYGCDVERFSWYLWKPATTWPEVAEVELTQTSNTRTSCTSQDDDVRVIARVYAVNRPWGDNLQVVDDDAYDRNPTAYLLIQDRASDGDDYTSTKNVFTAGGGVIYGADCRYSSAPEVTTKVYDTVGIVPTANLQMDSNQQRFLSYVSFEVDAAGGSYSMIAEPTVQARYKEAQYPTNVKYSVGNIPIDTLSGIQKTNATTLDFATQVNQACERTRTVGECSFNITFVSEQNGKMWIDKYETLKIADAPTEPPITHITTGFWDWLKSIWAWIISLFTS